MNQKETRKRKSMESKSLVYVNSLFLGLYISRFGNKVTEIVIAQYS